MTTRERQTYSDWQTGWVTFWLIPQLPRDRTGALRLDAAKRLIASWTPTGRAVLGNELRTVTSWSGSISAHIHRSSAEDLLTYLRSEVPPQAMDAAEAA